MLKLENAEKVVILAQAGIQGKPKALGKLDSRFHGNDGKANLETFVGIMKIIFNDL